MTEPNLSPIVAAVLAKAPQWIRHDLSVKDAARRTQAEESLAAMIAAAIAAHQQRQM
jgi:Na+-transporting methylmalonyl-CoA/oxaloacetate decarboxylase gamma subunit